MIFLTRALSCFLSLFCLCAHSSDWTPLDGLRAQMDMNVVRFKELGHVPVDLDDIKGFAQAPLEFKAKSPWQKSLQLFAGLILECDYLFDSFLSFSPLYLLLGDMGDMPKSWHGKYPGQELAGALAVGFLHGEGESSNTYATVYIAHHTTYDEATSLALLACKRQGHSVCVLGKPADIAYSVHPKYWVPGVYVYGRDLAPHITLARLGKAIPLFGVSLPQNCAQGAESLPNPHFYYMAPP